MTASYYKAYVQKLQESLNAVEVTDTQGRQVGQEKGLDLWIEHTRSAHRSGASFYFIGNGASATMASHMASDSCKTTGLRATAFNDPALLTAVSNDISYEESFAHPLRVFGKANDILITISSSGGSKNVLAAIRVAREKKMRVITLSGMRADNPSRSLGDLNFYVPALTYGHVESAHQAILHCWLDHYAEVNRS